MNQQEPIKVIGNFSPLTITLTNELIKGKKNDEYTDQQLIEITSGVAVAPQEKGYNALLSAIKLCERQGVVWKRLRGAKKILCQNSREIIKRSEADLRHVGKTSRRSSRRLSFVDPDELPLHEKSSALALAAQLGSISLISRADTTRKLADNNNESVPQIEDVLKLFKK